MILGIHEINKNRLILLAFALGAVIAISVSYLAVTSYMDRNAAPAYFAEMAGKYFNTTNFQGARQGDPCIELLENGNFFSKLQYDPQKGWELNALKLNGGTWSMSGTVITLQMKESTNRLSVVSGGGALYDPQNQITFYEK